MTDIANEQKNEYNNAQQELKIITTELNAVKLRMYNLEKAYFEKMEALRTAYRDIRQREIKLMNILKINVKNER